MCGRFAMTLPKDAVAHLFDLAPEAVSDLPARHNICPTTAIAALCSEDGIRRLSPMRWGFLPHWAKTPTDGPLLINARAETVAEKPAFRAACRSRRCLVPATGFFEWKRAADGGKEPWFIRPADGSPMVFAGIWQRWQGAEGPAIETLALMTCPANDDIAPIHHRMPVLLAPEAFALWLGEAGHGAARLMRPAPEGALTAHPVSRRVNRASEDDPGLLMPLPPESLDEAPVKPH